MHTLTNEEKVYETTIPEEILITTENQLEDNFTEVGIITTTQTNIAAAKKVMRKQAAKFGGDAIIDFQITVIRQFIVILFIPIPVDNYICRGRVIRYI